MSKSHKLAFLDLTTTYNKPLKLAATDLMGPAPISTDYDFKNYISFIDAFPRHVCIYFLKSKSKTYNVVL